MCSPGNRPHTKYFCNYTVGITLIISIGAAANLLQLLSLLHLLAGLFFYGELLSLSLSLCWFTYLRSQVMICRNLYIWLTSSHLGQRLQPLSTIDSSVMEISKSMPAIFGQFSFLSLVCSFLPPYTGTFIGREHNFSFDCITSENNSQNARTKQQR